MLFMYVCNVLWKISVHCPFAQKNFNAKIYTWKFWSAKYFQTWYTVIFVNKKNETKWCWFCNSFSTEWQRCLFGVLWSACSGLILISFSFVPSILRVSPVSRAGNPHTLCPPPHVRAIRDQWPAGNCPTSEAFHSCFCSGPNPLNSGMWLRIWNGFWSQGSVSEVFSLFSRASMLAFPSPS